MVSFEGTPYAFSDSAVGELLTHLRQLEGRMQLLRDHGKLSDQTLALYYGKTRFQQIAESKSVAALDQVRVHYLGKSGLLTASRNRGFIDRSMERESVSYSSVDFRGKILNASAVDSLRREELLAYLKHGKEKCRRTIVGLTDEKLHARCGFDWLDCTVAEMHLYNMRHVQHHAAQLNLLLRQRIDSAPRWVRKTETSLDETGQSEGKEQR